MNSLSEITEHKLGEQRFFRIREFLNSSKKDARVLLSTRGSLYMFDGINIFEDMLRKSYWVRRYYNSNTPLEGALD